MADTSTLPNWFVFLLAVFAAFGFVVGMSKLFDLVWFVKSYLIARRDYYRREGNRG